MAPVSACRVGKRAVEDASTRQNGVRILLADDDLQVRGLFTRVLAQQRWEVIAVADGSAAVAAWPLCGEPFDLVILDLLMPGVNGLEAYRALLRLHPEARFLFVSGYADVGIWQQIRDDGQMMLLKPVTPSALVAAVRTALPTELALCAAPGGAGAAL